jgi:NAD(P)-dependent dehydrogenase (short-subunit alcohol dehydrogenase family)
MSTKKTYLITGASSGIGYGIALSALKAGQNVIATCRNTSVAATNHPEFASGGGKWARLDVSTPAAQQTLIEIMSAEESRQSNAKIHWVIVNNAGTMRSGLIEDQSESQIEEDLQVYIYGFTRVCKAALPILRKNRSGTLITMGSVFGIAPFPETHLYSALKAALTSLTDSYAAILRPLGIRVLVMEPGLFRTSLAGNAQECDIATATEHAKRIEAWKGLVAACGKDPTLMPGDIYKLGQRVVEVVDGTGYGTGLLDSRTRPQMGKEEEVENSYDTVGALRIVLGMDAWTKGVEKIEQLRLNYEIMKELAGTTDCDDVVKGRNASRAGGAPGEGEGWKE